MPNLLDCLNSDDDYAPPVASAALRRLAAAILLRALRDAYSGAQSTRRHVARDAQRWLLSTTVIDDNALAVTCSACCAVLELDQSQLIRFITQSSRSHLKQLFYDT